MLAEKKWIKPKELLYFGYSSTFLFRVTALESDVFQICLCALLLIQVVTLGYLYKTRRGSVMTSSTWASVALVAVAMATPISFLVWRGLPQLRYVQFPWRWLAFLGVVFALALSEIDKPSRRRLICILCLVPQLATFIEVRDFVDPVHLTCSWKSPRFADFEKEVMSGGYRGRPEYAPQAARKLPVRHLELPRFAGLDSHTPLDIQQIEWGPGKKVFETTSEQVAWVRMSVYAYPYWEALADGWQRLEISNDGDGYLLIHCPPGHHRITVCFCANSALRRVAAWVSLIALLSLMLLYGWTMRKVMLNGKPLI